MFLIGASYKGERWLVQNTKGPALFENIKEAHMFFSTLPQKDACKYELISVTATHTPLVPDSQVEKDQLAVAVAVAAAAPL